MVLLVQNTKYNRQDVIEVHDQGFIDHNTDWDINPPPNGVQIADDSPVEVGWKRRNGVWESPDVTHVDDARVDKKAEIAAARWLEETGGVQIGDMTIATDRESQALITGAALQATIDPSYTCRWKTAGGFVTLDAQTILTVATVVRQHVQACFDREAELLAVVEAAETVEAVQAVVWGL